MPISETVLIALITFASGIFGAVIGAVSSGSTASRAAKTQLQEVVIRENYAARLTAFQALLDAHYKLLSGNYASDLSDAFVAAANRASLVASPTTVVEITLFRDCTLSRTENRLGAVIAAMQKDLAVFVEPSIEKNHWRRYKITL